MEESASSALRREAERFSLEKKGWTFPDPERNDGSLLEWEDAQQRQQAGRLLVPKEHLIEVSPDASGPSGELAKAVQEALGIVDAANEGADPWHLVATSTSKASDEHVQAYLASIFEENYGCSVPVRQRQHKRRKGRTKGARSSNKGNDSGGKPGDYPRKRKEVQCTEKGAHMEGSAGQDIVVSSLHDGSREVAIVHDHSFEGAGTSGPERHDYEQSQQDHGLTHKTAAVQTHSEEQKTGCVSQHHPHNHALPADERHPPQQASRFHTSDVDGHNASSAAYAEQADSDDQQGLAETGEHHQCSGVVLGIPANVVHCDPERRKADASAGYTMEECATGEKVDMRDVQTQWNEQDICVKPEVKGPSTSQKPASHQEANCADTPGYALHNGHPYSRKETPQLLHSHEQWDEAGARLEEHMSTREQLEAQMQELCGKRGEAERNQPSPEKVIADRLGGDFDYGAIRSDISNVDELLHWHSTPPLVPSLGGRHFEWPQADTRCEELVKEVAARAQKAAERSSKAAQKKERKEWTPVKSVETPAPSKIPSTNDVHYTQERPSSGEGRENQGSRSAQRPQLLAEKRKAKQGMREHSAQAREVNDTTPSQAIGANARPAASGPAPRSTVAFELRRKMVVEGKDKAKGGPPLAFGSKAPDQASMEEGKSRSKPGGGDSVGPPQLASSKTRPKRRRAQWNVRTANRQAAQNNEDEGFQPLLRNMEWMAGETSGHTTLNGNHLGEHDQRWNSEIDYNNGIYGAREAEASYERTVAPGEAQTKDKDSDFAKAGVDKNDGDDEVPSLGAAYDDGGTHRTAELEAPHRVKALPDESGTQAAEVSSSMGNVHKHTREEASGLSVPALHPWSEKRDKHVGKPEAFADYSAKREENVNELVGMGNETTGNPEMNEFAAVADLSVQRERQQWASRVQQMQQEFGMTLFEQDTDDEQRLSAQLHETGRNGAVQLNQEPQSPGRRQSQRGIGKAAHYEQHFYRAHERNLPSDSGAENRQGDDGKSTPQTPPTPEEGDVDVASALQAARKVVRESKRRRQEVKTASEANEDSEGVEKEKQESKNEALEHGGSPREQASCVQEEFDGSDSDEARDASWPQQAEPVRRRLLLREDEMPAAHLPEESEGTESLDEEEEENDDDDGTTSSSGADMPHGFD